MRARIACLFATAIACSKPAPCVELVEAPAVTDLAPVVATELARAVHDGKQLLVYVGAGWCEPCQRFHAAVVAGQLDAQFGKLRLLVFDADRDTDALVRAGYAFNMIPLFVIPNPDGRSSGHQIQGSIKGDGAVSQITPRLQQLLAGPR